MDQSAEKDAIYIEKDLWRGRIIILLQLRDWVGYFWWVLDLITYKYNELKHEPIILKMTLQLYIYQTPNPNRK